ncbi:hypothetical protein DFH29DRAFT_1003565 [Suillus ampliporus]|nr:hypothetical protein DFH29DRAFT_1003565 [Suillus ampliporus]
MSPPAQRQVRFDIPMDTDEESQYNGESRSPTSNAGVGNTAFYFGIGAPPPRFNFSIDTPMSAVESASPTMQQPLNLGFQLPIQARQKTPPPSPTHQPFNLGFQLPPPSTPAQAALPAGQVQQPFNLGFQLTPSSTPRQAALPASPVPQPFNLGFQLTPSSTPPQAELPAGPVQQPFNLGFHLPIHNNQPQVAAHSAPAFNLGFDLPIPATQTTAVESAAMVPAVQTTVRHIGYNINNKSSLTHRRLETGADPSTIADGPSVIMPPAPVALPARIPPQPTLASLVGDAEQVAIDIVRRLNGEEFGRVAQMMVGGSLGVGEAIRDPKPDEVLDSNRLMLSAFCENRDRLTRIFKDLISLHHMAQVQERVVPIVNTLLEEVERAEALIADSE